MWVRYGACCGAWCCGCGTVLGTCLDGAGGGGVINGSPGVVITGGAKLATLSYNCSTTLAVTHYIEGKQRQGLKPGKIDRQMNVLRRAFSLGYQDHLVSRKPSIPRLPDLAVRNEFFTRDEVDVLLPYLPEYLRDVTRFAYLTGWRKGEIRSLRWNNVDCKGAAIRLEPVQNKGRDVSVSWYCKGNWQRR